MFYKFFNQIKFKIQAFETRDLEDKKPPSVQWGSLVRDDENNETSRTQTISPFTWPKIAVLFIGFFSNKGFFNWLKAVFSARVSKKKLELIEKNCYKEPFFWVM